MPAIIINLIDFVLGCLIHGEMQYYRLSAFNHYIYTILFVYLIFWICWKLDVIPVKYKDTAVIFLLVCASLMTMYTPIKVLFQWPVESIGFIWGLLIFHYKEEIKSIFLKYGMKIRVILGGFSFVFGVLYLRFKTVHFSGEYVLKVILGVLLLGFILSLCYRFSFKGRGITWLGNISYEIYLFHIVVINNLKDVLPECRSGLFIFFVMAGTLTGAALVHAAVQHVNRGIQKIKVANHKEE